MKDNFSEKGSSEAVKSVIFWLFKMFIQLFDFYVWVWFVMIDIYL